MDRLSEQLHDAGEVLGVSLNINSEITEGNIIKLGSINHNSLTLAKAITNYCYKIGIKVNIIMQDPGNGGVYLFDGFSFDTCIIPNRLDFSLNELGDYLNGNSYKFGKYSENKLFTSVILRMNGINTPREISFRGSRFNSYIWTDDDIQNDSNLSIEKENVYNVVLAFFDKIGGDKKIVVKPSGGKCGEGISMLGFEDLDLDFDTNYLAVEDITLIQEKVESYPIFIDDVRKDWNLRVLVTYDTEKNEYISFGIIGRIDDDGGPVNRSISADYISLENICKLAGLENKFLELKESIEETAIKSVKCISDRACKHNPELKSNPANFQNLAGVDIIIDEKLNPVVLEVNGSNSGCMYDLMKLEGVDSLTPIAKSIIDKINYSLKF